MNSIEAHHDAPDRVLMYLNDTSLLFLELGGGSDLVVASNTLFADNTIDCKGSQGYSIQLFGRLID
jgi:hypothetical protein